MFYLLVLLSEKFPFYSFKLGVNQCEMSVNSKILAVIN